jgi:hypothetical protein
MTAPSNSLIAAAEALAKVNSLVIDGQQLTTRMASIADQAAIAGERVDRQLEERLARLDGQIADLSARHARACEDFRSAAKDCSVQLATDSQRAQQDAKQLVDSIMVGISAGVDKLGGVVASLDGASKLAIQTIEGSTDASVSRIQEAVDAFIRESAARSEQHERFTGLLKVSVSNLKKIHEDSAAARQEIAAFSKEIQELGVKVASRQLAMVVAVGSLCLLTLVAIVLQLFVLIRH